VVRRGLRVLLEVQDGIEVAGEAGDGATALDLAAEHAPDVILLDLKLPGMDGLTVLGELAARDTGSRVLRLTSVTEPALAAAAVQAGAAGVLYKDVDPDALVRAIRAIHDGDGHLLLAPEAAGTLLRSASWSWGGLDALTSREREVARLVIDGLSTQDIATALFISVHTVRDHLKMIFGKMGVSRRQDMVATLTGRTPAPAHTVP